MEINQRVDASTFDAIGMLSQTLEIEAESHPLMAYAQSDSPLAKLLPLKFPALRLERLGYSSGLQRVARCRYPYMAGAMANGIASVELVSALGREGFLGSYGAAGLSLSRIDQDLTRLKKELGEQPFAVNLIHSPYEPDHEMATAQMLVERDIHLIEASAYLRVSDALIYYRAKGLKREGDHIAARHRVIAKLSRPEVAKQFLAPPDPRSLARLRERGLIDEDEAQLAALMPLADSISIEADSGGHTDNRPALTLFPSIAPMVHEASRTFGKILGHPIPVGLGGGLATPSAVAAAFAMGADYVVTGTINQSCLEAGTSDLVKRYLSEVDVADIVMAPAADMFEMGVKVQVLKRRTLFPMRAARLFQLYQNHRSIAELNHEDRAFLEDTVLRRSFDQAWDDTAAYFEKRDPRELQKAERDPRHKMALVFRSYLGLSSRWAIEGSQDRAQDFQIWCGPAMAAFNAWVKGSCLEALATRSAVDVAFNLLYGAGLLLRLLNLKHAGIHLPHNDDFLKPRSLEQIEGLMMQQEAEFR